MKKLTVVTALGLGAWLGRKQLGELAMNIEVSWKAWRIVRIKMRERHRQDLFDVQVAQARARVARRRSEQEAV